MPATFLDSTNDFMVLSRRSRRSDEKPTDSGLTSGISPPPATLCACFTACAPTWPAAASNPSDRAAKTAETLIHSPPYLLPPIMPRDLREQQDISTRRTRLSPERTHSSRMI